MISDNSLPLSVPAVTSALNKSPVLKWLKPNFSTILAHCVPLPLPGPPKIQMIGTSLLAYNLIEPQMKRIIFCLEIYANVYCYNRLLPVSLGTTGFFNTFKHVNAAMLHLILCSHHK